MARKTSFLVCVALFISFVQVDEAFAKFVRPAKNVILFIGDGMGSASIAGARIWKEGVDGELAMEKMQYTGFSKTFSSDNFITDSAAGATALATGVKAPNEMLGMTDVKLDKTKKSRALQSIIDLAAAQGKSVGLVTTTRVTHATPAGFYAHTDNRDKEEEIALQISKRPINIILGGGREFFYPVNWKDPQSGKEGVRKDGVDLVSQMKKQGWIVGMDFDELKKEMAKSSSRNSKIMGIFSYSFMQFDLERKSHPELKQPSLSEMVDLAISVLSKNRKGFFLMVEGGKIDHAAHGNSVINDVADTIALDDAIKLAMGKIKMDETLMVVTADHECGGLGLGGVGNRFEVKGDKFLTQTGVVLGTTVAIKASETTSNNVAPTNKIQATNPSQVTPYAGPHADGHTSVDVPVMASGVHAEWFTGFMQNSEIPWKMAKAMGTLFTESANIDNRYISKKIR